ncbi:MAG TPA: SRPBCC domain-containing protein [Candidatus Limnocylindria bacterium]|nr:SRPBCC domain-containing protein [Candidatus Limnocylindria bacterium]
MTDIVIEQRIRASVATVYTYLTDAELWKRWQGVDATLDARVGGVLSILMPNDMNARGEFVELVPDRRVVFTWGWVDQPGIPVGSTTVEIELRPDGAETVLVLTHRYVPDDQVALHRLGWAHYVPRLAQVASGLDAGEDSGPEVSRPSGR